MSITISKRSSLIKPSPTIALNTRARELQEQGKKIIDLTIGEPDFATPEHIKNAGIKAIKDNFTKYTPVDGITKLKLAIVEKFAKENNLKFSPKQIMVSCGAKQAIYNLLQAIINPGDEVIIPAPYWVSYPDMTLLAEGKPVIIETDLASNFKITPTQLKNAITAKSKVIILNSPSNPTGVAYSKAELEALAKVLVEYPNLLIVSDDIYEHILWNHLPYHNILNVCPALAERTVVINGVSKAYAMTGWRIGYAAGPINIIATMKNIQSQSTSGPCSISQVASLNALESDQSCIEKMRQEFKKRHDYLVKALNALPGIKTQPADGAFYLFPNVKTAMEKFGCKNDMDFADLLLEKAEIAVVPGLAFGAADYIRLSYATSMEHLEEAIARLAKLL